MLLPKLRVRIVVAPWVVPRKNVIQGVAEKKWPEKLQLDTWLGGGDGFNPYLRKQLNWTNIFQMG